MTQPADSALTPGHSLAAVAQALANRRLPPVEKWNPPYCGDIDMRIARNGQWYYMGTPIGRPAMVKLFSTVLRREPDGRFVLVTPVERLGIKVEDAPFTAVELVSEGAGKHRTIAFRLNTDDMVIADTDHAIRVEVNADGEPAPYVHVRRGLDALIVRSVFYEMVELALQEQDGSGRLGLWSAGTFFAIGSIADD